MNKLIVANWKSNKNQEEAELWLNQFEQLVADNPAEIKDQIVIAPPYSLLPIVAARLKQLNHSQIFLAAQDISAYPAGSYTGAVSARNLEDLNVKYAVVGHSERRRYFHETHQDVANKVNQAFKNNITPIVCCDEGDLVLQSEVIEFKQRSRCVVAYEPLSAIGTGENEPVEKVTTVVARAQKAFAGASVLYGGSVKSDNVGSYLEATAGVLVGGASLDAQTFAQLIYRE